MRSRALRLFAAFVLIAVLQGSTAARAQSIPRLADISEEIARAQPELTKQKGALTTERDSLRTQTQDHRTACKNVAAGSAADAKCAGDDARLSAAVSAHIAASNRFNAAVAAAGQRATACAAVGQLKAVDRRAANLEKAIEVLGDPELFKKDREHIVEDLKDSAEGLTVELVNLASLGLARGAKEFTRLNVLAQKANAGKFASQIGQIANEEARLEKVVTELKDVELVQRVLQYKGALNRVRIAEEGVKTAETIHHLHGAAEALLNNYEHMKEHPPTRSTRDLLYGSSVVVGSVALIFVEGPAGAAAMAGSAAASVAIGGREAVNLWQEMGRLATVYQDAAAREQMKQELIARLGAVRQRQAELAVTIKRAGTPTCGS